MIGTAWGRHGSIGAATVVAMLVGIGSDVHGRSDRLRGFVDEARAAGAEELWCLGDVVDALIGADPRALAHAVALAERECDLVLGGNHEAWALRSGLLTGAAAVTAASWSPLTTRHGVTLVHASLRDPIMEFVDTAERARGTLREAPTWLTVHGHTHTRRLWAKPEDGLGVESRPTRGLVTAVDGERLLACPGALTTRRPCWLLADLDARTLRWHPLKPDRALGPPPRLP